MPARAALLLLLPLIAGASEAAIPWFRHLRPVPVAVQGRQNFFTADASLWSGARSDLGDLRLYAGDREIPYALVARAAARRSGRTPARVLDLRARDGRTHVVLETEMPEYDRIYLDLAARDFVAEAVVDGRPDLQTGNWTRLAAPTFYDLSSEQLGSSSVIRLPLTRYRYLRIRLPGPVRPQDVRGAAVEDGRGDRAMWTVTEIWPTVRHEGRMTAITWRHPRNLPLDRIRIDTAGVNFRRAATLRDQGDHVLASGHFTRVRLQRHGGEIASEDLHLDVAGGQWPEPRELRLVIDNGDNEPLAIQGVRVLSLERRVYFEPDGATSYTLYYGDPELRRPEYDYARLFHEDANAARVTLGEPSDNPAYTGRPDGRPWSERHPAVLWSALIGALLGLGALAVRAFREPGA